MNAGTALAAAVRRLRVAGDDSLTLDRQREAVRRFASVLTSLVYDPPDPMQGQTAFMARPRSS